MARGAIIIDVNDWNEINELFIKLLYDVEQLGPADSYVKMSISKTVGELSELLEVDNVALNTKLEQLREEFNDRINLL